MSTRPGVVIGNQNCQLPCKTASKRDQYFSNYRQLSYPKEEK